jgi:hypothetical protein
MYPTGVAFMAGLVRKGVPQEEQVEEPIQAMTSSQPFKALAKQTTDLGGSHG